MTPANRRTDLPVLLLHNLDRSWSPEEVAQTLREVSALESAIRQEGHPVVNVPVRNADLHSILTTYNPEEYVVLNWCEDLPGFSHSDMLVAETLESLRFSYTGSPPSVLALSWDKPQGQDTPRKERGGHPALGHLSHERDRGLGGLPGHREACRRALQHRGGQGGGRPRERSSCARRVEYVLETFHQPALVEDFIDGREFHVSIFGDGQLLMLPPAEMDFGEFSDVRERLCTFDSKFVPGSAHYKKIRLQLPARLDASERETAGEDGLGRLPGARMPRLRPNRHPFARRRLLRAGHQPERRHQL